MPRCSHCFRNRVAGMPRTFPSARGASCPRSPCAFSFHSTTCAIGARTGVKNLQDDLGDLVSGEPALQGGPDFRPLLGGQEKDDLGADGGDEGIQVLIGKGIVCDDQEAAAGVRAQRAHSSCQTAGGPFRPIRWTACSNRSFRVPSSQRTPSRK